jgi:hypothetical protein
MLLSGGPIAVPVDFVAVAEENAAVLDAAAFPT